MKRDPVSWDENISTEKEESFPSIILVLSKLLIVPRSSADAFWMRVLAARFEGAGKSIPSSGQLVKERA